MYRIRFHGRGGQGIKTASRILGSALFHEGFQVQDAPRYGAERRGAPIFAYVRASREAVNERGIITRPNLVVAADDSLMSIPTAGVCQGIGEQTVLLLLSREPAERWVHRLNLVNPVIVLPPPRDDPEPADVLPAGPVAAGAAARLLGVVKRGSLIEAMQDELGALPREVRDENLADALRAWDAVSAHAGTVAEGAMPPADSFASPRWVESLYEKARVSAPVIHEGLTSVEVRTGLWRTLRPVIDHERCKRCWWVCSTFCPDSAIRVDERGSPSIDYDHCKGCMICVAKCPPHAIEAIPEHDTLDESAAGETVG